MSNAFTWTVQFTIDESWIADGFELTEDVAFDMLSERLGYAFSSELSAKIVKAPSQVAIKRAQGYELKEPK